MASCLAISGSDQPGLRISVIVADGDLLTRVASSGDFPTRLPDLTYRVGQGITGKVFSQPGFAMAPDMPAVTHEPSDQRVTARKGPKA